MNKIKAEIISIGNELLAGITVNTNAAYLAKQLKSVGIETQWITTIADERDEILSALKTASQRAQVVISTGGLGPTPDDITKRTICEFFGVKLEFVPEVFEDVRRFVTSRKFSLNKVNREQAVIPQCDRILRNLKGTAPGLYFERNGVHYFFLPGVPGEVYHLTEKDIIPLLKDIFHLKPLKTHLLRTTGIPESRIIEIIGDLVEEHQNIRMAFLPRFRGVDLRFTAPDNDPRTLAEFETLVSGVRRRLQKYIFTEDELDIEEIIGRILRMKSLTLSIAESFTGGLIGDMITNIPGSSDYFLGDTVTYSNESKIRLLGVQSKTLEKFGAVSEETVKEMVRGVQKLFNSNCAIATTGIAGPGGATETKPVGLSYIAARVGEDERVMEFQFGTERLMNKKRGAIAGMELLRRLLLKIE